MNPQQNRNNGQTPSYGVNSTPQRNEHGHYEVLPPPSVTGHSSGHNPYEFIVNPVTVPKKKGLLGGDNLVRRVILIVGGAVVVMIIAGITISALTPKSNLVQSLLSITQEQQEILRISGNAQATDTQLKNFTATTLASITTNQTETISFLTSHKQKVDPKYLALGQDASTDQKLADATSAGTYNTIFEQILLGDLQDYQHKLATVYKQTKNSDAKALLARNYSAVSLILSDIPTVSN
jgi:hypothetical protein